MPFHWFVIPGKIGSVCDRNCLANFVTCWFVCAVVDGFDCESAPAALPPE